MNSVLLTVLFGVLVSSSDVVTEGKPPVVRHELHLHKPPSKLKYFSKERVLFVDVDAIDYLEPSDKGGCVIHLRSGRTIRSDRTCKEVRLLVQEARKQRQDFILVTEARSRPLGTLKGDKHWHHHDRKFKLL